MGFTTSSIDAIGAVGGWGDLASWEGYEDAAGLVAGWHAIGTALGIRAFGINACTRATGGTVVPEHDEAAYDGQEELYVVVAGRARFTCDGTDTEVGPGGVVHVTAEVRRVAVALESPTTVLMIGGIPDEAYRPALT